MFTHWDWVRRLSGYNSDWKFCVATICENHEYSEEEKCYLHSNQLCQNFDKLERAMPKTHYICRIFCHQHYSNFEGSCKLISGSPSHYHVHFRRCHGGEHSPLHHLFYKAAWTYWKLHCSPPKAIGSREIPVVAAKPSIITIEALKAMEVDSQDNANDDNANDDNANDDNANDDHGAYYIDIETNIHSPLMIDDVSDRENEDGESDDAKHDEVFPTPGNPLMIDFDDHVSDRQNEDEVQNTVMETVSAFDAGMVPSTLSHIRQHFKQLIEPKPEEVSEFVCRPCVKQRYQIHIHQQKFIIYISVCSFLYTCNYI